VVRGRSDLNPGACDACGGAGSAVCSVCRQARYCGRECQRAHWEQHKLHCAQSMQSQQVCLQFLR
jgi:hypothetical protein